MRWQRRLSISLGFQELKPIDFFPGINWHAVRTSEYRDSARARAWLWYRAVSSEHRVHQRYEHSWVQPSQYGRI